MSHPSLFSGLSTKASRERVVLEHGAWLEYVPGWLSEREATELFERLFSETAWQQREIVLFGRRVMQPRLVAWAGEVSYGYSGQVLAPRPPSRLLVELLRRVSSQAGVAFNHILLNRYRGGQDSMGLHADDEPELGPEPRLASLSLGAPRRFVVLPRRRDLGRWECTLRHGSLLLMGGTLQRYYRHGVPRTKQAVGERLNLTFRRINAGPG